MGLVQRDGIHRLRHAKRYSGQFDTICTNMAWTGWFVGHRRHARRRSARDGEVGLHRHLGHQCGRHTGQCDDPRGQGPQGARREDRRHRHLRQRHDEAGGYRADAAAGHRRGARLRGDARRCSGTARRTATIWSATPTIPPGSRRICRPARRNGRPRSPASPSPRSRLSPRWSARRSAASSASATASPASATAPWPCTRRCRSPAVDGHWRHEGGGAFHSNSDIFGLDKSEIMGVACATRRSAISTSRASAPS